MFPRSLSSAFVFPPPPHSASRHVVAAESGFRNVSRAASGIFHALKSFVVPAAALAFALSASAVHAQVLQLTRAQMSTSDVQVLFPGAEGTGVADPYTLFVSSLSQTFVFSNNATPQNGNSFQRQNNRGSGFGNSGGIFGGDFAAGTPLLLSVGNDANSILTLTFSNPVSEIGFDFEPTQSFAGVDFTFQVNLNNGYTASPILFNGIANINTPGSIGSNGHGGFFGVRSPDNNITSIVVYAAASKGSNANIPYNIALGPMIISPPDAIPEPILTRTLSPGNPPGIAPKNR